MIASHYTAGCDLYDIAYNSAMEALNWKDDQEKLVFMDMTNVEVKTVYLSSDESDN